MLSQDSVVLTFEYKSTAEVPFLQVFFAAPITEDRSTKTKAVPANKTGEWVSYSADLNDHLKKHGWGNAGDYLRLDLGDVAGITMQIRNIHLRAWNDEERKAAADREEKEKNLQAFEKSLVAYLGAAYPCSVTQVRALQNKIVVTGNCSGSGSYSLAEITPWIDMTKVSQFDYKTTISGSSFSFTMDRYVTYEGIEYDRLLSKWAVVKNGGAADEIVSHARYAETIYTAQHLPAMKPATKKGLGGFFHNQYESDLDDLGITSITVNIPITAYMYASPRGSAVPFEYGGKTYYFDENGLKTIDNALKDAQKRNIVVAAIILIQKAADCPDAEIGRLLQHPDYTSQGIYTMPNMTNSESMNCYAAALEYLAQRYCRSDNANGRIHHWIMHNEVDAGLEWTNMGVKPITVYTDTYIKSMRMCYNIARQYDENTEVFGSFTHSWATNTGNFYATKDMLDILNDYCKAEGDFQWALAYHSYPEDLTEPKTWNDKNARFSMTTPLITFKNLEVLDKWAKQSENKYKGTIKRSVWLSENGTNSRSYSQTHLEEQAAGFAYAWKKIKALDGIDGIQWHNWFDNRAEYGLRIGLRKFPDQEGDPAGPKPVWFVYEAAGTDKEDEVFDPYKAVIGITNWNILQNVY